MSTTIEERVVQMRFDNKQFEAGAKESMSTLDKLKEKLNFKGAVKGLEDVSRAAEKVSLTSLGDSADKVSLKFDALAVVAVTALSRITNAAISTGTNLVKSMSVDQVTAGFGKYEQKVQSVQTIMNATGRSIEEVEYELSKLIWFTDETSYSFSDMVNNVGKFTSNQIDLTVAVRAMMGIADAAGLAGVSVNDASHAMDGFSKAIAQGYMTRQNWQWIRTAHMDTAAFKEQLLEAAVAIGTLTKVGNGAYKTLKGTEVSVANFEEGMKDAWLNTNVMIKTLERFGGTAEDLFNYVEKNGGLASDAIEAIGDQLDEVGIKAFKASQEAKTFSDAINATKDAVSTGWMETFDILFGNYQEAKELWTGLTEELYEIFAEGGNARNDVLRAWKEKFGGRDIALEGISAAWINLKEILGTVKKAIRSVFPVDWVSLLTNISNKIKAFGEGLKLSEEALYGLGEGVKLLLVPVQALIQVGRIGLAVIEGMIPLVWKLVDAFLSLPSKLGGVEGALRKVFGDDRYERIAAALHTMVQKLGSAFLGLVGHIQDAIAGFRGLSNTKLGLAFEKLRDILQPIADWILDRIVDGIEAIANFDYSRITDWAISGLSFVVDRLWDVKEVAGSAIMAVVGFFKEFDKVNPVDFFNNLISAVINLKNTVKTTIKGLGVKTIAESIKEETSGITSVIHGLAEALQGLMAKLTPAKILVFGFGVTLTSVMLNVSKAFESFSKVTTAFSTTVTNVGGVFKAIQDRIKPNKVNQIAWALLLLAGALVAMAMVPADRLMAAVQAMAAMMGGLVVMMAGFAAIQKFLLSGEKLGTVLKDIAKLMLSVAAAVAILAAAMLLLQQVNFSDVIGPLALVITTMLGLALTISVLAKYTKGDLPKNALTLVAFALAIKMVVGALQDLADADLSGIIDNIGGLIIAVTLLGALALLTKKISFKTGAGMTILVLDLLLFAQVLKMLGGVDAVQLTQGIMAFMGIMTAMLPLFALTKLVGKEAQQMGLGMIALSASILLLQIAIKQIGSLDLGTIIKGTAAVAALLGMFTLLTKASWLVGKESGSMGKSFIAMAAAILLLGVAIDYIGHLDFKTALQGTASVAALLLVFGQVMKSTGKLEKNTGSMVALLATIGMLTAAVMLLTLVPFEEALQSVIVLSSVMLAFGATMKLVQGTNWQNGLTAALTMGGVIVAFAAAFIAMKDIDGETMLQKAVALSAVMLALGVTMRIINGMSGDSKVSLKNVLGTVTVLAAAAALLGILEFIPFSDGILEKALALSSIMLAISAVMAVLGTIKTTGNDLLKNAAAFAVVSAVIVGLVAAIGLIATAFDSEGAFADAGVGFLAKLVPIIPILAAITAITWALSKVSTVADAAGKGAVGFAKVSLIIIGVIAGVGLIGAAIDAISGGKGVDAILETANRIFLGLAEIVGGSLARLITSFGTGITGGLKQMGQDLSDFANNAKGFFDAMRTMDQSVLDGVVKMVEMMSLLAANDLVNKILSFGTSNPLADFGDQLIAFAPKFVEFANLLKDIPIDSTMAAGECLVGLAELISAIPAEGGLWQDLFGGRDFSKFGSGLKDFAEGFKTYCEVLSTANITQEAVEATKCATDALVELANKVPESGGILQRFFGEHDLERFGKSLGSFGTSLANFFSIITGGDEGTAIDFKVVEACASAGKALAKFAQKVPAAGGRLQDWFGKQDIGVFGWQLMTFGNGLVNFFKLFSGEDAVTIDQALVDACVTAGEAFASFSEKVPRMGRAFEWFTGKQDMGVFGTQIQSFGEGLAGFFAAFKGAKITDTDVSIANTAMDGFGKLSQSIGQTGGLSQAWSSSSLDTYGKQVKKLGKHFADYYDSIKDIDFSKVNLSIKAANDLLKLSAGIDDAGFQLTEKIKQVLNDILNAANEVLDVNSNYSSRFYEIGRYIVEGLKRGIEMNKESLKAVMTEFGNEVTDAFAASVGVQSPSTRFMEIGGYIVEGLTIGIRDNLIVARDAIIKMGQDLLNAIKGFFGIHSPSTVMRDEVGRFLIQGIADGITSDMSAEEAASKKAQNIINAFKSEFEKFSLDATTADLEYNLWEAMNPNATDAQISQKKTELLVQKLKFQAERVSLANVQYQATLEQLGETAEETQQSYNTYLQEQISMAQLAKELLDAQGKTDGTRQQNFQAYAEYMNNYAEALQKQGFTMEEIQEAAQNASGWTPPALVDGEAIPSTVEGIMTQFLNAAEYATNSANGKLEIVYQNSLVNAINNAGASGSAAAGAAGLGISDALGMGIMDGEGGVTNVIEEFVDNIGDTFTEGLGGVGEDGANSLIDKFMGGLRNLGDSGVGAVQTLFGLITGASKDGGAAAGDVGGRMYIDAEIQAMKQNGGKVADAAVEVTDKAATAASKSGYEAFLKTGQFLIQGLISGMSSNSGKAVANQSKVLDLLVNKGNDQLGIQSPSKVYYEIGEYCMQGLANGMKDSTRDVSNSQAKVLERVMKTMSSYENDWSEIGSKLTMGLSDGMKSGQLGVSMSSDGIIDKLLSNISKNLNIRNNTSKEFYQIGKSIDQGLRNGIINNASIVEGSISKLNNSIQGGISPVMDWDADYERYLKEQEEAAETERAMREYLQTHLIYDKTGELIPTTEFRSGTNLAGYYILNTAKEVAEAVRYGMTHSNQWGSWQGVDQALADKYFDIAQEFGYLGAGRLGEVAQSEATFNFTQINNSPTALDRSAVYRDTRNMFSEFKSSVELSKSGKFATEWAQDSVARDDFKR